MATITTASERVNAIVSEIAAATVEQSTGIGQITTSGDPDGQVTQTNAAAAEESASAGEELPPRLKTWTRLSRTCQMMWVYDT